MELLPLIDSIYKTTLSQKTFFKRKNWVTAGDPKHLFRYVNYFRPQGKQIGKGDLKDLEQKFERFAKSSSTPIKEAWFDVLETSTEKFPKIHLQAQAEGWTRLQVSTVVNLWFHPTQFKIPKGFSIGISHYNQKPLDSAYTTLTCQVFKMPPTLIKRIKEMVQRMRGNSYIVSIQNEKNKTVAEAGVTINGEYGWLFGGCVLPKYQNKGLWKVLTGARQEFSAARGVTTWLMISFVPKIMKKGDAWVKWSVYTKALTIK